MPVQFLNFLPNNNHLYRLHMKEVPVLIVTPSSRIAETLQQLPNISLQFLSPEDYNPEEATSFPLILFHLTAPATLPATNASPPSLPTCSSGQLAFVAKEAKKHFAREAKERQGERTDLTDEPSGNNSTKYGKARDHAAKAVGTNSRYPASYP